MMIGKKRFKFFWALAWDKTQVRHDLFPLRSRILCSSLLFVDNLFSVCFSGALCISFSRCSLLDIRLFTYTFYCSLWRSSRRILPILASFLTFFRVFLDSLYAFYFLLSLVALSLSFQPIFTHNPFSTNLNYNKFLCRYFCFASWLEIAKYWEFLFNFNLTSLISLKRGLQVICLRGLTSTNSRAMPNHVPAVRHVVPRHSSMRTSLSSTGVSCCTLLRQAMCALQFRCIVVASFSIWRWKRQKSADFDWTFRKS